MSVHRSPGWVVPLAGAVAAAHAAGVLLAPRNGIVRARAVRAVDFFTEEEIRRARCYGRPQMALQFAGLALDAAVLAVLVRRRRRETPSAASPDHPLFEAAARGARLSIVMTAGGLPLSALARQRALDVGLATQSWRGWADDVAKAAALNAALAGGGSALAIGLMRASPDAWWLPGAVGSVGLTAGLSFVGPVLLDPIFNRFTPLGPGQTRDDVTELARAAGVRIRGAYEMDASRRTTAANAYVNGIGATRRVVLFDTLLKTFTRDEARLVVAHELAHVRHRDVPRSIAHMGLSAPLSLRAAARLTARFDGGREPTAATLPALALALGIVSAAVSIAGLRLSREVERRADSFALRLTDAPEAFVSFERRIVLQNFGDPDPPRWLSAVLGSHPSTVERIGIALAYKELRTPMRPGGATRPRARLRRACRTRAGS